MRDSDIIERIQTNPNNFSRNELEIVITRLEDNWKYFDENLDINCLQQFLFNCCNRYNRFAVPTPFVLEDNSKEFYSRFLKIFHINENTNLNTAVLDCDKLLWDTFDIIKSKGNTEDLKKIIKNIRKIKSPIENNKTKEFLEHKLKLKSYISGYFNSTIITKVETVIPVSPVTKKTIIKSQYNGIKTEVHLSPKYFSTSQSFLQSAPNSISLPQSDSNWQNSICEVEIIFHGLVDSIEPALPLCLPYPNDTPFNQWPSIFNDIYIILESISWKLNSNQDIIARWLINPSDIGKLNWEVYSNKCKLESILKDPPSQIIKVTSISETDVDEIHLNNIENEIPWYSKCLKLAKGKLSLGETNESLFWLNVGVESLFEDRSSKMMEDNKMEYNILNSGRSYWLSAMELIKEQFPEIEDKIIWPESSIGIPSWYTKIKYLDKEIGFRARKNEILKNFSNINKYRNSLFHGSKSAKIESSKVEKSIKSYNWLIENFKE